MRPGGVVRPSMLPSRGSDLGSNPGRGIHIRAQEAGASVERAGTEANIIRLAESLACLLCPNTESGAEGREIRKSALGSSR